MSLWGVHGGRDAEEGLLRDSAKEGEVKARLWEQSGPELFKMGGKHRAGELLGDSAPCTLSFSDVL